MKIIKKIFRKIKARGNKIFSIVSLLAMLANSFAPVLAAIPTYTYAEGTAAPVEVLTKEDKEETKVEEKIELESVSKEEVKDDSETLEEEASAPENLKNNEDEVINETESQTSEEVTQDEETEVIEEEVLEENQEGDILEDGVSDYRPEVEITEDEVKEVEEVSVLKETVNPVKEIIEDNNEEVTEATASAEEPVLEDKVLESKEKEYKYLKDGAVVDSTKEDWNVDGEVAETKKVVKIGVKYIFPLDEDVSVTFTKLPKSEEDRADLKIERVKVKDLNLPDEFSTDAEYAFDITTEGMENGEFEYDLTLPKPKGIEAKVISIEEDGDIVEASDDDIDQKEEIVEVKDQSHFSIKVPVYSVGKWVWVDKPEILVDDTLDTNYIKWDKNSTKHSGLEFIGKQDFDVDIDGEEEFELGTLKHHNHPIRKAIEKARLKVTINLGYPVSQTKDFNMELEIEETPNSGTCPNWHTPGNPKCDDRITFPKVYSKEFFEHNGKKYVLEITGFIKDGNNVEHFITKEGATNEAVIRGRFRSIPADVTICDRTNADNNPYVIHTPSVDGIWTEGHDGHNGPIWYPGLKDLGIKWGDIIPSFRYFDSNGDVQVYPGKNNTEYGLSILENGCQFPEGKITVYKEIVAPAGVTESFGITGIGTHSVGGFPSAFNGFKGNNTGTVSPSTPVTFDVYPGKYTFEETAKDGWVETYNDCKNVVVGNGDNKTCTIKNTKASTLTIVKHAEQVSDTSFNFTATGNGLSNFSLIDNSPDTDPKKVFTGLLPGEYSVTEDNLSSGWTLKSAVCDNGQNPNALELTAGSDVTCTFTNTQQGSLTIVKKAVPHGSNSFGFTLSEVKDGGSEVIENFNLTDNSEEEDASKTFNLGVGRYAISETDYSDDGWSTAYECSGNNTIGNIVLNAGDSVICTFTNTKLGSISGYKYNDRDGDANTTTDRVGVPGWTIILKDKDGAEITRTTTGDDGHYQFTELLPGDYIVAEGLKVGWIVLVNESENVTLGAGKNEEVNFINVKYGSIQVLKNVDGNGDGDLDDDVDVKGSDQWNWAINGETVGKTGTTKSQLRPGKYEIKETDGLNNYHFVSLSCTGAADERINIAGDVATIQLESGENVVCTYTNAKDIGTLIVKKVVNNDNGGSKVASDFSFKIGDNDPVSFESDGQNEITVDAGTYTITEPEVLGYLTSYSNCSNVVIPNGGTQTCTITNDDIAPELQLVKKVTNDNGGSAKVEDFTLKAGDITFTSGVSQNVNAGTYVLTETGPEGYSASAWSCTNGVTVDENNGITLGLGQSTVCTITNDDLAPKLQLVKEIKNNNGGGLSETDWTLTATGPTTISGNGGVTSGDDFKAGTYTLSETGKEGVDVSGYEASAWSCTDVTVNENNEITLGLGQSTVCTITNSDIAPKLKLVKAVENGNGGPSSPKDWTLTAKSETEEFSNLGDADITHTVTAGVAYTLSETGPEKYEAGKWECTNNVVVDNNNGITLGLGQSTVCTITNTYSPVCIDDENIGADIIASVVEGRRYDGGPIAEDRTNPGNALGTADEKFYSLGKGGKIVLAFTGYVENVAGNDFSIYETTWGRESYVEERAEVWVAKDIIGIDDDGWVKLGEASNHSEDGITHFDFGSTGLPWIRAVKLVESSVNQTNGDGFDLDAIVATSHVCKEPSVSKVEICKVDNKNRPQEGWDVVLASEKVDGPTSINVRDGNGTDSTDLPAGKYLIKVSGTYRYGNSSMNADAGFSYRPQGIPSGCDCWLSGFDLSSGSKGLMALVNGNAVNWGAYNNEHVYTYVYDHDGGKINISILDNIYGDNVNNKNFRFEIFRIPVGYYGTTGGNRCVTLENVLYGDYILDEILKEGWIDLSGKGSSVSVDSPEETFKLVNRKDAPVTIVATKIVCNYEEDLPNWGYGDPTNITKDTAKDFVAEHTNNCRLEPDWSFQWGNDKSVNPGDDHVGEADGWNTFGPTDNNGVATVEIKDFGTTSQIKVREVLKANYFPFTYLTNGSNNDNNVSAEIYCDVDVLNYDNDDRITPEYGNTYYCVAWNVEKNPLLSIVKSGSFVDGNSDGYANVGETINYTFTVKNEGNVTLTNVTVTDPKVTVVGGPITLGVGETDSTTFTASYVITQADIDAGKVDNTATADSDESKPATDDETVSLPQNPLLSIVKSGSFVDGNSDGYANVGETINYTFTVKNEGNVTLTNVTVTDILDGLSAIDCEGKTTLEVGESMSCTATYAVTQADIDAGRVDNMATAGSDQSEPVEDDETVDLPQNPALSIVKSAEPTTYDEVGDVISYSYVVTNSGNVTLYGIEVEDDKVEVKCPDTSDGIAPLDTVTCVASYTITQSDLDNGSVTNVAYATNEITKSDPDSETVEAIPTLSISKSNDSYPTAEKIGNKVTFTIKVTAHRNNVDNVKVYDLFSKGFEYVKGSWAANSSVRGNLKLLGMLEPKYASPASWDLGNMQKDEVVTLTYLAEVTDSVTAGTYRDLAWTQGETALSDDGVLGYSEEEGRVNDSFVGTQVLVEVDPSELKDKVSVKEKKVEGEVLGASTLPATGSRTLWVKIVLALLAIGGTLMVLGTLLDKDSNKKGNKKGVKKSLISLFVLSLFIVLSHGAYAASTVVRISEPKTPVTEGFNLVFVAMDIQDRDIVAKCFYKFGDSSYSQFGPSIAIPSGESGDSRTCAVDSKILDKDGKYTFKVEATAGGTTVSSEEVSVDFDGDGPSRPEYIKKEKVNNCINKITLKTADDGETKYVKVYADNGKEISIKDSNLIETEDLGPNKKFSFEHIVSGDACKKDWYYAVVAFDSAGNASGSRSETITKVIETTSGTEEEVVEAIPVVGGAGIAEEGGAVAGDQEVATTEGEEAQNATEEGGSTTEGNEEEGSVLGEQTEKKSAFKSPWLWVVLVGLGIIVASVVKKDKKN